MREIVLDTETTGFEPSEGHRIIEIGAVELENHLPTGKTLQLYINPERDVPAEAIAVHGITNEFLKDKPVFAECYTEFTEFAAGAKLVIHNAQFDLKFLNHELAQVGIGAIPNNAAIDTLDMARRAFPGSPANLDALCRRFGIDNTERTYHGALLDSELLAEVYLELLGGRQHGLTLGSNSVLSGGGSGSVSENDGTAKKREFREPREFVVSAEEKAAHAAMVAKLKAPLWPQDKSSEEESAA